MSTTSIDRAGGHRRSTPRRTPRLLMGGLALAVGTAPLMGAASDAAVFSEVDVAWVKAPASVENGDVVQGVAHVNLNDDLGAEGSQADTIATLAFEHGTVAAVPDSCKQDSSVTPKSSISTDGTTLTCNLGTVRHGTAAVIEFTVRANGKVGDSLTGTASSGGSTTPSLTPIPITSTPGIDVVFNTNQKLTADGQFSSTWPVSVAIPRGGEPLSGPISFDVVATDDTSTDIASVLAVADGNCGDLASTAAPTSMPATSAAAPVPTTCTITRTAPGVFHVVMDGYKADATSNPPTTAVSGDPLPESRLFFATAGLKLRTTGAVTPSPASFDLTVKNVEATGISGAPAPEVDASNNTVSTSIVPNGSVAGGWYRRTDLGAVPGHANDIAGDGSLWDAAASALPGDDLVVQATNAVWGSRDIDQIPAGTRWEICTLLDGPVHFDGGVAAGALSQTGGADVADYYPESSLSFATTTASIGASGARDDVDCGSLPWTPTTTTKVDAQPNGTPLRTLDVADPSKVTAIKLIVTARALQPGVTTTPARLILWAGADIDDDAAVGTDVWSLSEGKDTDGDWVTASTRPAIATADAPSQYPSTTNLRDLVNIIGGRPHNEKTASVDTVHKGDKVTYTITTSTDTTIGTSATATWTDTDTLPAGMTYVDGSASPAPASTKVNSDGTTTLVWNLSGPYNVDKTITYDAIADFTGGTRTNVVVADGDAFGSYTPTEENGGIATATVAYSADGRTVLTKESLQPAFAAGANDTWRLGLTNLDEVDQEQTDIIDVLPWNGDARGSAFHGTIATNDVTLNAGETVWYTTAEPSTIKHDPAAPANGAFGAPGGIWSTTKPADATAITGVRIVGGTLAVGATKTNNIVWEAVGAQAGDQFENVAWAKATHTRLQMIKAAAASTVLDGSELQIDKETLSQTGFKPGDTITYSVDVKNPSDKDALKVVVTDLGGTGLDPESIEISEPSQGSIDADGVWQVGILAPGAVVHAKVTATIAADYKAGTPITNVIYVANPSNPFDPTTGVPECQATTQVDPATGQEVGNVDADTDQCDVEVITPPAPEKPVNPPAPEQPVEPASPSGVLPQTGGPELWIGIGALLLVLLGAVVIRHEVITRRKA